MGPGAGARRRRAGIGRAGHRAARRGGPPRRRPRWTRLRGEPERPLRRERAVVHTPARGAPGGGVRAVAGADGGPRRRSSGGRGRRRRRQRRDHRSGPPQRARRHLRPERGTRRTGRAVGARRARRLRGVGGRPSGAAIVVWFRHRGAGRWRLEAATRAPGARSFGAPAAALGVRAPPMLHGRVRRDRGARRRRRDVELHGAPRGLGGAAPPGAALRPARRLAADASDAPRAVVGAGGAAAVLYSTQHVPLRAGDGLQLHRASPAGAFGPAEHVNGGGGVTVADAAVTPAGRVLVAWCDRCTARACTSPRRRPARRWPPAPSWAPTCAPSASRSPPTTPGAPWWRRRSRPPPPRPTASVPWPRCAPPAARRSARPSRWEPVASDRAHAGPAGSRRRGARGVERRPLRGPARRRSALLVTRLR